MWSDLHQLLWKPSKLYQLSKWSVIKSIKSGIIKHILLDIWPQMEAASFVIPPVWLALGLQAQIACLALPTSSSGVQTAPACQLFRSRSLSSKILLYSTKSLPIFLSIWHQPSNQCTSTYSITLPVQEMEVWFLEPVQICQKWALRSIKPLLLPVN